MEKVCKSKKKGGLGIKNLRKMNISLLCKLWWKLEKEEGLWQDIVRHKYLRNNSVHSVTHRLNDSPVWYDLLEIKEVYLLGRKKCTKDGCHTRFWKDSWVYQQSLCLVAPDLFELCDCKDITVKNARNGEIPITFRRWLPADLRGRWEQIWRDILVFPLENVSDEIRWSLEKNNKFSVKSTYNALTSNDAGVYHKLIWKGKIPAKIKIFMWLMINDAILTKDNLIRRKWKGDPACHFCDNHESISHPKSYGLW